MSDDAREIAAALFGKPSEPASDDERTNDGTPQAAEPEHVRVAREALKAAEENTEPEAAAFVARPFGKSAEREEAERRFLDSLHEPYVEDDAA
jgi:hypothetical protein